MGTKFIQHKTCIALFIFGLWLAAAACTQAGTAAKESAEAEPDTERLIRVHVYRLIVDPATQQPVVSLVDSDEKRAFPIWIGLPEARAIHSELQGEEHFRPLTHDLLAGIIGKLDAKVHRIVITHAKDNVYYATLVAQKDESLIEIDARPSDSIVLALKTDAPIYVTRSLFDKMSVSIETPQSGGQGYGLSLQEITPQLAGYLSLKSGQGVMVSAVRPDSRAAKGGIIPGDILVDINGQAIADVLSAKDLMENSKEPLKAKVIRGKQTLIITLHPE